MPYEISSLQKNAAPDEDGAWLSLRIQRQPELASE